MPCSVEAGIDMNKAREVNNNCQQNRYASEPDRVTVIVSQTFDGILLIHLETAREFQNMLNLPLESTPFLPRTSILKKNYYYHSIKTIYTKLSTQALQQSMV